MSTRPAQDGLSGEPARRFEGQRALVTGAASGIGRAVARRLGLEGAVVIGLDTQTDDLLKENLGSVPGVHLLTMDVCSEEAAAQAGAVDVLVNAAGILSRHPLLEHPLDVWQRTLDVNLKAPLRLSREFARAHVEAGIPGAIVNVCSIESFVAGSDHAAHARVRAGAGAARHPRERRRAGGDDDGHELARARRSRAGRCTDRGDPAGAHGYARGAGCGHLLPCLARRRLHNRRDAADRRRLAFALSPARRRVTVA
jgi:hypothetical protein